MMQKVGKEQSVAIAAEMKREREIAKQKAKRNKSIKYRILCWSSSSIAIIYLIWLFWAVVQVRMEREPELGRCLIPKGNALYSWYNNLKWVDCEIDRRN